MNGDPKTAEVIALRGPRDPAGPALAPDLLHGADAIAHFLFGSPTARRRVYRLQAKGRLPIIRVGGRLCARRSALREWFHEQERRAAAGRTGS